MAAQETSRPGAFGAGRCDFLKGLETDGKDRFFLVAEYEDKIIGSIEYGIANDLLNSCTNHELEGMLEIGTVFVRPEY